MRRPLLRCAGAVIFVLSVQALIYEFRAGGGPKRQKYSAISCGKLRLGFGPEWNWVMRDDIVNGGTSKGPESDVILGPDYAKPEENAGDHHPRAR